MPRQCRGHHRDEGRSVNVLRGEIAATLERHAHAGEVAGTGKPEARLRHIAALAEHVPPFHREAAVRPILARRQAHHCRGGRHPGNAAHLAEQLFVLPAHLQILRQRMRRSVRVHHQHSFAAITQRHIGERHKAAEQQPRANCQHEGQSDLRDNQSVPQPVRAASHHAPRSALFERFGDLQARSLPRRRQAEHDARNQRGQHGEQQRRAVQAHFSQARQIVGRHPQQRGDTELRQRHSQYRGRQRQHQVLHRELADHAPAARAQRVAHGHLPRARRSPRQQQVRHVGARNQQHQPHRSQQQIERRPHAAHQPFLQRDGGECFIPVAVRVSRLQARGDGIELRLCGLQPHTRPQLGDGVIIKGGPVEVRRFGRAS